MMDKTERNAVWHESVERFGTRLQSVVCMEECAELIQAVSKRLRGKPDPDDNLAEEMADVYICLGMLRDMYGVTDERLESWSTARRNARRKGTGHDAARTAPGCIREHRASTRPHGPWTAWPGAGSAKGGERGFI